MPDTSEHDAEDRFLRRLLKYPSGLRAEDKASGEGGVASYWTSDGDRSFSFRRDGLVVDPDGLRRFIPYSEIEDTGYYDGHLLRTAKMAVGDGKPLHEDLVLTLKGGELIALPLNARADGISERLTIAGLVDRFARMSRIKS